MYSEIVDFNYCSEDLQNATDQQKKISRLLVSISKLTATKHAMILLCEGKYIKGTTTIDYLFYPSLSPTKKTRVKRLKKASKNGSTTQQRIIKALKNLKKNY